MSEHKSFIELRNTKISEDENGNICLNDLWDLAGRPENHRPRDWYKQKRTKALEAALLDRFVLLNHKADKNHEKTTYYVYGRGSKRKTYAHPVLALDYAEIISPEIGVEIREIFLRYKSNDISLANDILDRIAEQIKEDANRIQAREEISVRNKELAREGKKAGCAGWQYGELHNSGYRGLYKGLDEGEIHKLKRLTKNQKILDHMCAAEGAANLFRVTQAKIAMQQRKPKDPQAAFDIAHEAGVITRQAMKDIGGVMPEDMPAADSISEAKKRLQVNKELLPKK